MRTVAVVIALLAASPALAGTWSFSFPAAYCEASVKMTGATATGIDLGAAFPADPPKFGWSFAPSASVNRVIACDVAFPGIVNSADFTVNLTWQTADAAPSSPPQVCWIAEWEITRPGQQWTSNVGNAASLGTSSAGVGVQAQTDIRTGVAITAADDTSVVCATGTDPNTCAGSHGELIIGRLNTIGCANESVQAGVLTRIEVVGTTP